MGSHRLQEQSTNQNEGVDLYKEREPDKGERVGTQRSLPARLADLTT